MKISKTRGFQKVFCGSMKSQFTRECILNFHSLLELADKNEKCYWKKNSSQRKLSVNIRANVIGDTLIWLHFPSDTLNGDKYLEFLKKHLDNCFPNR